MKEFTNLANLKSNFPTITYFFRANNIRQLIFVEINVQKINELSIYKLNLLR